MHRVAEPVQQETLMPIIYPFVAAVALALAGVGGWAASAKTSVTIDRCQLTQSAENLPEFKDYSVFQ
jgi:hypothetical protein